MSAIADRDWDAAVAAIRGARHLALACHLGPDGDALGSMIALGLGVRALGADVIASWSDPYEIPRRYLFLPGLDLTRAPAEFPAEPELMVTFDAGAIDRLGTLEPNARKAATLVVVDHHASNDRFGHVNLVDPDAAASAVIVYELLGRLGVEIDRDAATCLYAGLVTDTGRFQYRNTTPAVHAMAADLLARGVDQDDVARRIYDTNPEGYLRVLAGALDRMVVRVDLVWTWVTQDDLRANGIGLDDTEPLIDAVRTAPPDVAIVLKEQPDGAYKVSMRSKGATDVGAVCASFGGGGHALAAGFTARDRDPSLIIARITETIG